MKDSDWEDCMDSLNMIRIGRADAKPGFSEAQRDSKSLREVFKEIQKIGMKRRRTHSDMKETLRMEKFQRKRDLMHQRWESEGRRGPKPTDSEIHSAPMPSPPASRPVQRLREDDFTQQEKDYVVHVHAKQQGVVEENTRISQNLAMDQSRSEETPGHHEDWYQNNMGRVASSAETGSAVMVGRPDASTEKLWSPKLKMSVANAIGHRRMVRWSSVTSALGSYVACFANMKAHELVGDEVPMKDMHWQGAYSGLFDEHTQAEIRKRGIYCENPMARRDGKRVGS
jgi:hypothetical protein